MWRMSTSVQHVPCWWCFYPKSIHSHFMFVLDSPWSKSNKGSLSYSVLGRSHIIPAWLAYTSHPPYGQLCIAGIWSAMYTWSIAQLHFIQRGRFLSSQYVYIQHVCQQAKWHHNTICTLCHSHCMSAFPDQTLSNGWMSGQCWPAWVRQPPIVLLNQLAQILDR